MLTKNLQIPEGRSELSEKSVRAFVTPYFQNKEIYLNMAEQYGSPLYVLETDVLAQKADRFMTAFRKYLPDTAFFYAMKSNNLPYLSKTLLRQGFGLDVSSGMELKCALDLGARSIIFSGPGKTDQELELALHHPKRVVTLLDSLGELNRLASILDGTNSTMRVGIRLNNNPNGLWRKFGIAAQDLLVAYKKIQATDGLEFQGLQFHSSWNLNPDRQVSFIKQLGNILASMPADFLNDLKFIDIGGGYWPDQGEWLLSDLSGKYTIDPAVSIDIFAEKLSQAIKDAIFPVARCRICFEPGRWICNDAMHILIQVVDQKAHDLVITDAGTNTIGWERYEVDYCPVLNLTRPGLTEKPCHILGALCTPHDVWGFAYLGSDIKEGDILMIPAQGAYTYSLRQQFIKPLPRVAVKTNSQGIFLIPQDG